MASDPHHGHTEEGACEPSPSSQSSMTSGPSLDEVFRDIIKPPTRDPPTRGLSRKLSATWRREDNLENCDPEMCVRMLSVHTVKTFASFKRKLKKCDEEWMAGFLEAGGVDVLLEVVETMSTTKVNLKEALVLLECVICVRTLMNSRQGLEYIIRHKPFSTKLIKAMDTGNVLVKQQVMELLSALVVFSQDGFDRCMATLEHCKEVKGQRNRFTLVVNELRTQEAPAYVASVLTFINCVIRAHSNLRTRVLARNEFLRLSIRDVFKSLRRQEDEDIHVQVKIFMDSMDEDKDRLHLDFPEDLDLNNHQDLFNAILLQLENTPHSSSLLGILQSLVQVDPASKQGGVIWPLAERAIQTVVVVESDKEAERLIQSTISSPTPDPPPAPDHPPQTSAGEPPPPPPPCPPAPPAPAPPSAGGPGPPPAPPPAGGPGPPPVPPPAGLPAAGTMSAPACSGIITPKPKSKMRTINWKKIPRARATKEGSIWKEVLGMEDVVKVDYQQVEQLFCQKQSPRSRDRDQKQHSTEVNLLDMKRSMAVNIFLRQFKREPEEIVRLIEIGDDSEFGDGKLKGLHKILPDKYESEVLMNFDGDRSKLGSAEQFLLQLLALPHYQLRVEGMLLRQELQTAADDLAPNLQALASACRALVENQSLRTFLRLALHTGNFINAGGYAGNASGFKVDSLAKFVETRANTPRMSLLHFLVREAEVADLRVRVGDNPGVLAFADALLEAVTPSLNVQVDSSQQDIQQLEDEVRRFNDDVDDVDPHIKDTLAHFLKSCEGQLSRLRGALKEVHKWQGAVAACFCEDDKQFKLEDCLDCVRTFCDNVKRCQKELLHQREEEAKAERRRQQQQHRPPGRRRSTAAAPYVERADDSGIVEGLLKSIKQGAYLQRSASGMT